jgi:hypothetical protein
VAGENRLKKRLTQNHLIQWSRGESPNQKLPLAMMSAATLFPSSSPHQFPIKLIVVIVVWDVIAATIIPG